ncbi:MAG: carboxypeptidase-like regulatory domain-containing protein [Euryarchaeota archaeon]|nr:carboxypeptidase-like regulatory domain-containing protein [Euryarchaeota archaeon]
MGTVEEEVVRGEGTKDRIPPPPGTEAGKPGPAAPPPPYIYQQWGSWYPPPPQAGLAPPRRRSSKPKMVGILLMLSGALSVIMGLVLGAMMMNIVPWMEEWSENASGNGEIGGQVIFMNSTPAAGVNVTVVDLNLLASTDETGHYRILGIENGWHDLKVEAAGYKTLVKSVYVYAISPQTSGSSGTEEGTTRADFQLRPGSGELRLGEARTPGSKTGPMDENAQGILRSVGAICFVLGIVLGLVAIVGGYFAFRTEKLAVVALGALCGILSLGFVIGAALAFIALILLLLSTDEFDQAKKEKSAAL